MSTNYVIGIDLGTQSTKTAIFNLEGQVVGEASQDVALHYPRPGWVEQDPDEFYSSVVNTIRQAISQARIEARDVKALALDSQVGSLVRIDRDGKHLGALESYLDTRATPQRSRLVEEYGDLFFDRNGINPYVGPKLMWWKEERPDEYKRTYKALGLQGYIGGRLAGLKGADAVTDPSHTGLYGLVDIRSFTWSQELVDIMGLDREILPRIVKTTDVIGELTVSAANDCGLKAGTPIVAGAGDCVAGWLGVGAVEPGVAVDTSGSTHHLAVCVDRYVPDMNHKALIHYPAAIPDLWYPMGYTSGTGRSHSWFIDEIMLDGAEGVRSQVYILLDAAAESIPPGSEGVIFSPHFGGRWCPFQPNIRGHWLGLTWKHTRAHLYRALLESIAYEFRTYLEIVREMHPSVPINHVIVIGGGAKSKLWNQIKADVTGINHTTCNRSDFPPLGSAIIAGHAVGLFPDMAKTAKEFTQTRASILPRPEVTAAYRRYADFYGQHFAEINAIYEQLASISATSID